MSIALFRKPGTRVTQLEELNPDFGDLCVQEIPSLDFAVQYYQVAIFRPLVLNIQHTRHLPILRIMMKSDMMIEDVRGAQKELRESQVVIISYEFERVHLQSPGFYSWIDIHLSPEIIANEILPLFTSGPRPQFCSYSSPSISEPQRANPELLQSLHCMLFCTYSDELRAYYCNLRVKDILVQYFVVEQERAQKRDQGRARGIAQDMEQDIAQDVEQEILPPSRAEVDAINIAERIITTDLSKHFFIPQLARKVNMNECRFKTVFKELYGTGPFEYRQRKRLEWGRHLLDEEGMSVKAVAIEIGYRTSSFVNIFREHYGYTPGLFQKSRKRRGG